MSRLLQQPATWPALNLNPEPRGTAADSESVERLYQEWFGPGPQIGEQTAKGPKTAPPLAGPGRLGYRPSPHLHSSCRRR